MGVDQVDFGRGAEAVLLHHGQAAGVEDVDVNEGDPAAVGLFELMHDGLDLAAGHSHGRIEFDELGLLGGGRRSGLGRRGAGGQEGNQEDERNNLAHTILLFLKRDCIMGRLTTDF